MKTTFIYDTKDLPIMTQTQLVTLKQDLKQALKEIQDYENTNRKQTN